MSHEGDPAANRPGVSLASRIPFVATIIGLLALGLASTLLLSTRAAEDSYQLSEQRAVNQELSERSAALQRDVEIANSAPELARRATQLGMIPTRDVPRLLVLPDGVVQVIGTPAPASGPPAPDFASGTPRVATSGPTGTTGSAPSGSAGSEALTPVRTGTSAGTSTNPTGASQSGSVPSQPGTAAAQQDSVAEPAPSPVPVQPRQAAEPAAPVQPAPADGQPPVGEQQVPIVGGDR